MSPNRKQALAFYANCLLYAKTCFLGKIRKIFQYVVCWIFYRACKVLTPIALNNIGIQIKYFFLPYSKKKNMLWYKPSELPQWVNSHEWPQQKFLCRCNETVLSSFEKSNLPKASVPPRNFIEGTMSTKPWKKDSWQSSCLMPPQPLWVILCHLPERRRKWTEEMID